MVLEGNPEYAHHFNPSDSLSQSQKAFSNNSGVSFRAWWDSWPGKSALGASMTKESKDSVLIVGAGVVGIACAHYLSKAGWKVTVIDQSPIANACSYANCGYICPSHVLPLTEPGAIKVALKSLFQFQVTLRVKPTLSPSLIKVDASICCSM